MVDTIVVTFPTIVPVNKVKFLLEENLKKNSIYSCTVEYTHTAAFDNIFNISSAGGANAFYLIGMTSSVILEAFNKRTV